MLRCLYYALIEHDHSLDIASYFLNFRQQEIREHLVRQIASPLIRAEWEDISSLSRLPDFLAQVESARNRLFRFLASDQIRRIVGLGMNSLDIEDIIERGKILLVNLQPSDLITEEQARLLGTLLLNEIWEVGMRRRRANGVKPTDYFLIIDEFQKFLTPDIPAMLDQAAKYGLHLFLFHQHLAQLEALDAQVYGSVMTNARIKLVFGGLSRGDARRMAEEIFPGQVDLERVKFLIEQTKFWPVYTRDQVYSSSTAEGSACGTVSGMAWDPEAREWIDSLSVTGSSHVVSQEGVADIPLFYPVPFREVSSIETYSLEEMLWQMSDRLMEQYQRHFFIRRPGKKTVAAVTPFVTGWHVTPKTIQAYEERLTASFLTAEEVTERLAEIHRSIHAAAGVPLLESGNGLPPLAEDDEEFSGPEVPIASKKTRKEKG